MKVRALEGLGPVGGGRNGEGKLVLFDESTRGFFHHRQRPGVDIMQHNMAAFQHLALQNVANGAVTELGASRPD